MRKSFKIYISSSFFLTFLNYSSRNISLFSKIYSRKSDIFKYFSTKFCFLFWATDYYCWSTCTVLAFWGVFSTLFSTINLLFFTKFFMLSWSYVNIFIDSAYDWPCVCPFWFYSIPIIFFYNYYEIIFWRLSPGLVSWSLRLVIASWI